MQRLLFFACFLSAICCNVAFNLQRHKRPMKSVYRAIIPKNRHIHAYSSLMMSSSGDGTGRSIIKSIREITKSPLYSIIEGGATFVVVSAVDGAYSGDWSRYQLISLDQELWLQQFVTYVGFFHLFCMILAAGITSRRQQPVLPAVMHTALIGGLGLFKVLMQEEGDLIQFPNFLTKKRNGNE